MRTPWLLAVMTLIAGCAEPIEKLRPNRPPETFVTSGPPDSVDVSARVHFQWSGQDPDGSIDRFEIILVDHPAARDSITGDATNRVIITVPRADDPRWTATALVESTFVTLADTLRRDPQPGPGETPEDVRRRQLERWHTLFVRAVDDRGTPDATPAYRSFNARTLAPTVELLAPVEPGRAYEAPPLATFRWTGEDPLDEFETQPPVSSRWIMIPWQWDFADWLQPSPDTLYAIPDSAWSPWEAWSGDDGGGGSARIPGLPPGRDVGSRYVFAVQAKDEAGAVTAVFDWRTPGKNNTTLLSVVDWLRPIPTLTEPHLGIIALSPDRVRVLDVAAGQPLRFSWLADASHYSGTVVDCRFGWNLLNPDDPSLWQQCTEVPELPPVQLETGTQRLSLEVTDDNGFRSRGTLLLQVRALTRNHTLLLVDDTSEENPGSGEEAREDARWLEVLAATARKGGFDFSPYRDVYDVLEQGSPPSAQRLFDYGAVIWHTRLGRYGGWSSYTDEYDHWHNYAVQSYLMNGGSLWVVGFRPSARLWIPSARQPANVTTWQLPQPSFGDSLGVASLNYELGVEVFDTGAMIGTSRDRLRHFCAGLRPMLPDAPALVPGPEWSVGPDRPSIANVEIYNMPGALAAQVPPLQPPLWRTIVPYTYISNLPEDAGNGVIYPRTADGQPVVIVTKRNQNDAYYSRALCGFDIPLLTEESHTALATYILLDKFGIGATETTAGGQGPP